MSPSNGRFDTQSSDDNTWVGVSHGHNYDSGEDVSEFIIQDKNSGEHIHLGLSTEDGHEVFRSER